jgi:hypothetical protein
MSEYQTNIPAVLVDEQELRDLVDRLTRTMNVEAKVSVQLVVETDSIELSSIMDNLWVACDARKASRKKTPKKEGKETHRGTIGGGTRSLTNEKTKAVLSSVLVAREVKAGNIPNNTTFINSRGERLVVMDKELIKEPQS